MVFHVLVLLLLLATFLYILAILLSQFLLLAALGSTAQTRRILLIMYSACTFLFVAGEVLIGKWMINRVQQWGFIELIEELLGKLRIVASVLSHKIENFIQDIQEYGALIRTIIKVGTVFAVGLQLVAVVLALVLAYIPRARPTLAHASHLRKTVAKAPTRNW